MRLLSRLLFTFALLGGLAFGSYAFGKHVLSSKLFGNKGSKLNQNFGETTAALPATRSASRKSSDSAIASVEVLPESGDGGAPSRPAASIDPATTIDRSNAAGDDGAARSGAGIDQPLPDASSPADGASRTRRIRTSDSASETPTPRKKRRKRRKPRVATAPPTTNTEEAPARQDYGASPDAIVRDENTPRDTPEVTAPPAERIEPRRETPSSSSPDAPTDSTPRRRRRPRTRVEEPATPRTRIEPRRETPTRRDESPIPRPEGGGGGESPVPVPE